MACRFLRGMGKPGLILLSVAVLTLAGLPAHAAPQRPDSMAALGDSITRAFNACGFYVDCPAVSWSTGFSGLVDSHYRRILRRNPDIEGRAFNDARSGATVADLGRQAQLAVEQQVDYVTILIGANDACAPTEEGMTPVSEFEDQLRTGMSTLRTGLPEAALLVVSVPDIKRLWKIGKDNADARAAWAAGRICQSMLADPLSEAEEVEARRDRVRQRVIEYNDALQRACNGTPNCRFDGNVVFEYDFELQNVSAWDYFHPNLSGQRIIAELTYRDRF